MISPNITWYIIDDQGNEVPTDNHYAGNYKYNQTLNTRIRVWNNRWGDSDVQTAKNISLEIEFFNKEDSIMLDKIEVVEDGIELEGYRINNMMRYSLKGELSGNKHSPNESENYKNYIDIDINLRIEEGLSRSLKNMIVRLDYDRSDS